MISLHILNVKDFMSQLLLHDTFDRFYLTEASITTFGTFLIDGHLQKGYFSSEELENEDKINYRVSYPYHPYFAEHHHR